MDDDGRTGGGLAAARTMQVLFAILSLVMLGIGLAVTALGPAAGFSPDAVHAAAFGMFLAAVAHAIAPWLWQR